MEFELCTDTLADAQDCLRMGGRSQGPRGGGVSRTGVVSRVLSPES
ncbi:hypothetical protein GCM10012280_34200 [Wenjunlia tyrosinilytica]|uniref:Uncharacterized protein n=1 Tax=Wenjunlia tyrosinilytica TaxID=1544741 RepID=A0A918DXT7_9ACTN|nr:hypothetical protein GCM10012280_34200 [Wenjunlia tyrosinilytica]